MFWKRKYNDFKDIKQALKKNRNVIYKGKTQNVMEAVNRYKGNYRMDFIDKHGKKKEQSQQLILFECFGIETFG